MLKKITYIFIAATLGCLLSFCFVYFKSKDQTRFMALLKQKNTSYFPLGNEHFYGLPLNNPTFLKASSAKHMQDDDLVIGIDYDGILRAYPGWVISSYNIINDTINGKPILVTYCKECHAAAAYVSTLPHLKNRSLSYVTCMFQENRLSMCDLQTFSLWDPFSGRGIEGIAKGAQLTPIPIKVLKWKEWLRAHPDSEIIDSSNEQKIRSTPYSDKFHDGHIQFKQ